MKFLFLLILLIPSNFHVFFIPQRISNHFGREKTNNKNHSEDNINSLSFLNVGTGIDISIMELSTLIAKTIGTDAA